MGNSNGKQSYTMALVTLTSLFFMWGFITCLNDLLIPYLREVFTLSHFQANMVQFAFFAAYFIISLLYFLVSSFYSDPIQRIGFRNTIVLGLVISAIACFLFFLEANSQNPQFYLFLMALFMLGTGFTFLQIAANPLVSVLGSPETSSSRLNLTQAFNSLGTTLAPAIGGYVIFTLFMEEGAERSASAVRFPYLFLASLLLILAGVIFLSNVPGHVGDVSSETEVKGAGALKHPYLVFGMFGIFCYVGAEVTIGSNLISFMTESQGFDKTVATNFLSFYWGGSMIGRFVGSISMSQMEKTKKYAVMAVTALAATALIFAVTNISSNGQIKFTDGFMFLGYLALNYICFILAKSVPSRTLGLFAIVNIILVCVMLNASDPQIALWSVLSVGLFNSIMFSNVFTLAIDGLKEYTSQGSSLLVMMILGGAIVPPVQGFLADMFNTHIAFAVPLICYAYLMWYGFFGSHIGKKKASILKKETQPGAILK